MLLYEEHAYMIMKPVVLLFENSCSEKRCREAECLLLCWSNFAWLDFCLSPFPVTSARFFVSCKSAYVEQQPVFCIIVFLYFTRQAALHYLCYCYSSQFLFSTFFFSVFSRFLYFWKSVVMSPLEVKRSVALEIPVHGFWHWIETAAVAFVKQIMQRTE